MIRLVFVLALALFVTWCSTSVKLGEYTCAGHIKRIWSSDETKDLRRGVEEKATSEGTREVLEDVANAASPVVDRVKRGVKAGLKEAADSGAADRAKQEAGAAAGEAARDVAAGELQRRTGSGQGEN